MSIVYCDKRIDKDIISPGEEFKVTLEITAKPDCEIPENDIVLVLDSSGSMLKNGIEEMKRAACHFVDVIAEKEGGCQEETLLKSRIAVISFNEKAILKLPLCSSRSKIKAAVNSINAEGYTNHEAAFSLAEDVLKASAKSKKTAVIFTDGDSNKGGSALNARNKLASFGTEIFTIALGNPCQIKPSIVKSWASEIKDEHFYYLKDKNDLCNVFKDIAFKSVKQGNTCIDIFEKLNEGFVITKILPPDLGSAIKLNDRSFKWKIVELGRNKAETALVSFNVKYTGCERGILMVNEEITYRDNEGSYVTFPKPSVIIEDEPYPSPDYVEPCDEPYEVIADTCQEVVNIDGLEAKMMSQGRIVYVNTVIKNVCPNKRLALGVILYETDSCKREEVRGMKTLLIPAHHDENCRDVKVSCIKFAVPEEISLSTSSLCGKRKFKVKTIVNYVDADITCCQ